MGWIGETIDFVKSFKLREALHQAISLGVIVSCTTIVWKILVCLTGSESPMVVVLSGSMEPGFSRGDVLLLHGSKDPIRVGEIVVYKIDGFEIPIVHRVIKNQTYPKISFAWTDESGLGRPFTWYVIPSGKDYSPSVHERKDTREVDILTKGDNNSDDDIGLYPHNQLWLNSHHIIGRVVGFLPYAGWGTIIMDDKPVIKYILIGVLCLLLITSKD